MTLGELLNDFNRLAHLAASQRWAIILMGDRLARYMQAAAGRYAIRWTTSPGNTVRLDPDLMNRLPQTARRCMAAVIQDEVIAECTTALPTGPGLQLLAYRVTAPSPTGPSSAVLLGQAVPSQTPGGDIERNSPAPRNATARREILQAIRDFTGRTGQETFTLADIVAEMRRRRSSYSESTVRTMVASHMCFNAPENAATTYDDLERTGRGTYRLRASADDPLS